MSVRVKFRCSWYGNVGRMHVRETKWLVVRGSGLFEVPGIASGSGWRLWKGCGTQNE